VIYKALHISLAILVYLSSIGYTLHKHYCKGELKNTAIYTKAEPCNNHKTTDFSLLGIPDISESPRSCCSKQSDSEQDHKGCCEDDAEFVQVEVENIAADTYSLEDLLVAMVVFYPEYLSAFNIHLYLGHQAQYLHFHPPLLFKDITVLLDSFLI